MNDASHLILVHESAAGDGTIDGFIIARAIDAPPVFDPGGKTCFVDDFVWSAPGDAQMMLDAIRQWGHAKGCRQIVVVTAAADDARRHLLGEAGLHLASEWWTAVIAPGQKV